MIFGIVVPFFIMLVAYSLVYKTLSELAATDVEKWNQRTAVMILAFCYFIFILPLRASKSGINVRDPISGLKCPDNIFGEK